MNYLFIKVLTFVGRSVGKNRSVDDEEMLRVMAYAFVTLVMVDVAGFFARQFSGFGLIGFFLIIYTAMVFVATLKRVLDTDWGPAIITIFTALIIRFIIGAAVDSVFSLIFGDLKTPLS